MKKGILGVFLGIVLIALTSTAFSGQEKPRIGVLRFTNQTHAGWWSGSMGYELQDLLASELASTKAFQVLERKEIDAVLQEQDFGASGRIDPKTKAALGKIKGAKYLVSGTVTAFETQTAGTGGGFSVGGFSFGGRKDKAYMAVDVKVIDTETGEIVDNRTIEASSEATGVRIGANIGFASGSLGNYQKTPTGKAIRACIIEISEYLVCSLTKGRDDPCMEAYAQKESKRRERTKGVIELE